MNLDFLLNKLETIGINREYAIKYGLPSWWDEELNDKPVAVLELSAILAERFNLDLKWLLSND